jgi:hypothetical protein
LRGRDIKQYRAQFGGLWVIFTRRGININNYISVKEHLFGYYKELKPRENNEKSGRKPGNYKWYEIQDNVAYYKDFSKEKLVWIELTDSPKFALDTEGYFLNNTTFFMTGHHIRYLLGFLNSSLCEWYFDKLAATSGAGTRRWIKMYIDQLQIPQVANDMQKPIVRLVNEAVLDSTTEARRLELKHMLDLEIFKLLNLTDAEAAFIHQQRL